MIIGALAKAPLFPSEIQELLSFSKPSAVRQLLHRLKNDGLILQKRPRGRYFLALPQLTLLEVTETPAKRETKREREARELQEKIAMMLPEEKKIVKQLESYLEQLPEEHIDRVPIEAAIKQAVARPDRAKVILTVALNAWTN